MFCLQKLPKFLLAAAIFSSLVASVSPAQTSYIVGEEEETSHRGSGRLVSQVPSGSQSSGGLAYRGTGRVQAIWELSAHRGSGRLELQAPETNLVVYRGSGRVSPQDSHPYEYA